MVKELALQEHKHWQGEVRARVRDHCCQAHVRPHPHGFQARARKTEWCLGSLPCRAKSANDFVLGMAGTGSLAPLPGSGDFL